jgi:hypothetical protein
MTTKRIQSIKQQLAEAGGDPSTLASLREADCVVCGRRMLLGGTDVAIHPRCLGWSAHRAHRQFGMVERAKAKLDETSGPFARHYKVGRKEDGSLDKVAV